MQSVMFLILNIYVFNIWGKWIESLKLMNWNDVFTFLHSPETILLYKGSCAAVYMQYKNIMLLIRSDHYLFEGTCSLWIELQFCMVICNNYWHYVMERHFFLLIKKSNIKNIYQNVFFIFTVCHKGSIDSNMLCMFFRWFFAHV